MQLKVYNTQAAEVGAVELNDEVFGWDYNEALIHQVIVSYQANQRQGTKSTLTRSEVRGGGVKPWKQKGTGRARQGSIRAPQWIKGGVVFAPKPRDFSVKINKYSKCRAMLSAMSYRVQNNEIKVLDKVEIGEAKTKLVQTILNNFKVNGKALIITDTNDEILLRAAKNVEGLEIVNIELLNVYQLVAYGSIFATKEALKKFEGVYTE
ncbi:MAG: 50S ribosomal protein L4 [Clostridia bacterium]